MVELRDIKDLKRYGQYLKAVGALSGLFSDNPRPLINYRTAEKLFNLQSGAEDVGRQDSSFDSRIPKSDQSSIGIGVKTFTAKSENDSSTEKVAEFSNPGFVKVLSKMKGKKLAQTVSELRNSRVTSDALQLGVDLSKSYYHCVVRIPGAVVLHEEPYVLIKTEKLFPTDSRGKKISNWPTHLDGHLYFGDGVNLYTFHRGKNVLHKRFDLSKNYTSPPVKIEILVDAFGKILKAFGGTFTTSLAGEVGALMPYPDLGSPAESVVLPLYSPGSMVVQRSSGINNWNAGGRARKFGEAYIPIPSIVHKIRPGFFPTRDSKFVMALPNGDRISAKVCQQGSKALMSDPNTSLCFWLYELIDGQRKVAEKRFKGKNPYTYQDLLRIGKDAVRISKSSISGVDFDLELVALGSFEAFVEGSSNEED
jgi:hypothetical protein